MESTKGKEKRRKRRQKMGLVVETSMVTRHISKVHFRTKYRQLLAGVGWVRQ